MNLTPKPITSVAASILLSCLLASQPAVSHSEETFYRCRGEVIQLKLDPNGLVVQGLYPSSKSKPVIESILDASTEVLHTDTSKGRFVYRSERSPIWDAASAKTFGDIQVFPLYTTLDGEGKAIAFDEISVRLETNAAGGEIERICAEYMLEVVSQSPYEPEVYLLRAVNPEGFDCFATAERIRAETTIVWSTPNLYTAKQTAPPPNDPLFPNQLHHTVIDTLGAWDVTAGSAAVRVAVLDGEVELDHEDLAPNVWINPAEASGQPGIDDDLNGYIDDFNGWDFFSNDNNPRPNGGGEDAGHGSAVTGLIAAEQDNGVGVAGVAPDVKFLSLKVFDNGASTGNAQIADAIRYAANWADIMNNSWASNADLPSETILDAIDYATIQGRQGRGCLVVFATGNGDGDLVAHYGSYPWTLAVSLTNYNDLQNDESSIGRNVDIAAPVGAWSTDALGSTGFNDPLPDYVGIFRGTSSAAPQVTAVGALVLSLNPNLTASEVAAILINSTDNPIPGMSDNDHYGKSWTLGYGRLNAHKAVRTSSVGVNDRFEPNDSINDAALLRAGFYNWLLLPDFDEDYFRIQATAGAPMRFALRWMNQWGRIEVELVDGSKQVVATPTITQAGRISTSTITHTAASTGDLYLRIYSAGGPPGRAYSLHAQVGLPDDVHEPNNSLGQASLLNPGAGTSYKQLRLNNDDFYRVAMTAGQYLYGLITFDLSTVDIGFEVFAPSGGRVTGDDVDMTHGEQFFPFMANETGDYVVRVFGTNGEIGREYSLHLAVLNTAPLSNPGVDDVFEDNDSFATATVLTEGFYPNLALGTDNGEFADAYTFTVPAGRIGRFAIGWDFASTDIDILAYPEAVVLSPPGTVQPIAKSSLSFVAVESMTFPVKPVDFSYWIEVVRASGAHRPYRLALEFLEPEPIETVGLWRFNEGTVGAPCHPLAVRDWRGPRMSHSPELTGSAPTWILGPDPMYFPGSDRVALQFNSGGFRFPGNGDEGELALGDRDFSIWARIRPTNNSSKRVIAAMPDSWEFSVRADDTLEMGIGVGAGTESFAGVGPDITPGVWQDVAMVWDRTAGSVRAYHFDGMTVGQSSRPIPGVLPAVGAFHIASNSAGGAPLGAMEQIRLFDRALTYDEVRRLSVEFVPSSNEMWALYP